MTGMKRYMKKNLAGQSLFEVVLALGIMTLITVGVVILTLYSIRNASFARNKNLAAKYAQEAIEWLRSERDNDISIFKSRVPTVDYCLNSLSWSNTGQCGVSEYIPNTNFVRDLSFTVDLTDKTIITATVVVYWTDSQGYHESRSSTDFTDIREK